MQSPSPALHLNFMAEPCACDCTCHECVMCGQQSPAPAISFYSSRAGCDWMVEASCGDQHRDRLGEQQRHGLQTGLAWAAGASDFARKAGHRLPGRLVRSGSMCLAVCRARHLLAPLPLDLLQSPAPASSGPCQFDRIAHTVCNNTQTIFCCVNLKL